MPETADVLETDIPQRMDRLPWTRWHWLIIASLGTVWVLDGLEKAGSSEEVGHGDAADEAPPSSTAGSGHAAGDRASSAVPCATRWRATRSLSSTGA